MASPERQPEVSPGCSHEIGWVFGSREPVDPNKGGPQDLSDEGYVGCRRCGEPVMVVKVENGKSRD